MCGWEFLLLTDNGDDGYFVTGNSAATAVSLSQYDLSVVVKTKKQLKEIATRLDWLGKYADKGRL